MLGYKMLPTNSTVYVRMVLIEFIELSVLFQSIELLTFEVCVEIKHWMNSINVGQEVSASLY